MTTLQDFRLSHGLNQQEMAGKLKIPQTTVWSWETGRRKSRRPPAKLVKVYKSAFGITYEEIKAMYENTIAEAKQSN